MTDILMTIYELRNKNPTDDDLNELRAESLRVIE